MILLSLDLFCLQTSKDRFILISYLYYALIYLSLLNDTSLTIVGVMLNMIRRIVEIEEEISSSNNMKPNPTISILLLFFQIIGSLKTKSWPIQVPRVSFSGVHLKELTVVHAPTQICLQKTKIWFYSALIYSTCKPVKTASSMLNSHQLLEVRGRFPIAFFVLFTWNVEFLQTFAFIFVNKLRFFCKKGKERKRWVQETASCAPINGNCKHGIEQKNQLQ